MPASVPAHDAVHALLAAAVTQADAALERELPPADRSPARLHAAMRYSVFAGGKRLRPALVLAACRAVSGGSGGTDTVCAPGLAAVELLHTYTLIHDDLPAMDDDDLRRGRPTCHKAFDEATAILAGDALQAQAFIAAAKLGRPAIEALGDAASSLGVIGGQQDDLDAEGVVHDPANRDRDLALLERIHRGKTAALIRASCLIGGIAAKATAEQLNALRAYGEALGLAFQIADDVLDATADAKTLGKTPGKDAKAGKLTYVALFGLDGARAEARRRGDEARSALTIFGPAANDLAALATFAVERDR